MRKGGRGNGEDLDRKRQWLKGKGVGKRRMEERKERD